MNPGTPQGTVNFWRAEADSLPAPFSAGLWMTSPKGVRFRVAAGRNEDDAPTLAWEVCTPDLVGCGLFFRPVLI